MSVKLKRWIVPRSTANIITLLDISKCAPSTFWEIIIIFEEFCCCAKKENCSRLQFKDFKTKQSLCVSGHLL